MPSFQQGRQEEQWERREQQAGAMLVTQRKCSQHRALLACPAILLTLKVVKQALGRVAELVTLSIEKHPAGQRGGAVGPRILHSQRAVASIPLARVGVAVLITIAIPGFLCTLGIQAPSGLRAERDGLLTVAALCVSRALAVIVRRLRMRVAAAPVLAGGTGTAWVCLAFLSHRQLGAIAPRTRRCLDALLPLLAFHLSTGTVAVELTFCSRITLQGGKKGKTISVTNLFFSILRSGGKVSCKSFLPCNSSSLTAGAITFWT